jgi:hypothetical protein
VERNILSWSELNEFVSDTTKKLSSLVVADREGRNIIYLRSLILFTEYQYGDQIPGECFRRRNNGFAFKKDWFLFNLRDALAENYINQNTIASFDIALAYATETRAQLEMRRSNDDDREIFFHFIYRANTQLGCILGKTLRYEESRCHYQEALTAARHCQQEDENKLESSDLFYALKNMASILRNGEGTKYAEEAYILVSSQHGPEHPDVQEAAAYLVDSCLQIRNFADAERFARITYECLIDPNNNVDRKGAIIALAKRQMAKVWLLTPPDQQIGGIEAAEEAETLALEACDIFENMERGEGLPNTITDFLSTSLRTVAEVMIARGKTGSEVEKMLLRALSMTKECRAGAVPRLESTSNRRRILNLLVQFYSNSVYDRDTNVMDFGSFKKSKDALEEAGIIGAALLNKDDALLRSCIDKMKTFEKNFSDRAEDVNGTLEGMESGVGRRQEKKLGDKTKKKEEKRWYFSCEE